MLLTGGSAVVSQLTGIPTAAAIFLFPIGVVVYTMVGGIKATFLTDYFNSLTILIIIFIFAFTVYTSDAVLGSPGRVYDILAELAKTRPLEGNAGGSYLTMRSKDGGIFFVINIIGSLLAAGHESTTADALDRQLRNCFLRQCLLQQSHCRFSNTRLARLYYGWSCLVCEFGE